MKKSKRVNHKIMRKNIENSSSKYKWWIICSIIILLIIAYPFIFLLLTEKIGLNLGDLYTFGLPLEKFMTPWIAFWGVIGAVFGVIQMQRRLTIMEKQQEAQQEQFKEQIEKQEVQIQIQWKQQEAQQLRWEKQDKQQKELSIEQQKQFEAQIENQQKQLRDTRFSLGVELLGNTNESARIGGAYNLYFLANEHRNEYLKPVCEILCAHIRTITSNKDYQETYKEKPSNEIQTILNLLFWKDKNSNLIFNDCEKKLMGTFLYGVDFVEATLNKVKLESALLSKVNFQSAKLNDVDFSFTTFLALTKKVYFCRRCSR